MTTAVAALPLLDSNPAWLKYSWLLHGTTTRPYAQGAANKHEVAGRLAHEWFGDAIARAWAGQVHGDIVATLGDGTDLPHCAQGADAIHTRRSGVMLASFTADCVPVVLIDAKLRRVGVAHAGWRGTRASIAARLVEAFAAAGSHERDLEAWLAPAISGAVYEVSEELADDFRAAFPAWAHETVRGRLLDLHALNRRQLEAAGLRAESIGASPHCTLSDPALWFSYRRDQSCGAHLCTAVGVKVG